MTDENSPNAEVQRGPAILAGVLSYLVPGLGQIMQGRFAKGVLFMVVLLGMFHLGQAMGDWQNVYMPRPEDGDGTGIRHVLGSVYNRWHFAGQVWVGIAAWPAIAQFFDIPLPMAQDNEFLQSYQRAPRIDRVNEFLTNSDKTPDLGWVYTVVAGMLNILVIWDAAVGPAHPSLARRPQEPRPEPEGVV